MGVFLLTPTKKAYLRYYQDLETDLMGPPEGPELLEVDTESLLRKPQEPVPAGSPSAGGLQVSCSEALSHTPAEPGIPAWGRTGHIRGGSAARWLCAEVAFAGLSKVYWAAGLHGASPDHTSSGW